jgi:hypothetical protein
MAALPTNAPDYAQNLTGEKRDAYMAITNLFSSYGLQSLAGKIFEYIQNGYSAETISILLQDTTEYKQRFAGNDLRKQKGLPVLSPAEYLSTESSYRQLMRQAGLPQGFYDQSSDFNDFIGKDVSPTELKSRVDLASQATALASPEYKNALQKMYGINDSALTAYFLDEDRALPILQKQAAAAAIGAEALKRGLDVSTRAEDYALAGVTEQQAANAYGTIAQLLPDYENIAHSYGQDVTQQEFEESMLGGQGVQTKKIEQLASWNRARSKGASGAAAQGLARSNAGRL